MAVSDVYNYYFQTHQFSPDNIISKGFSKFTRIITEDEKSLMDLSDIRSIDIEISEMTVIYRYKKGISASIKIPLELKISIPLPTITNLDYKKLEESVSYKSHQISMNKLKDFMKGGNLGISEQNIKELQEIVYNIGIVFNNRIRLDISIKVKYNKNKLIIEQYSDNNLEETVIIEVKKEEGVINYELNQNNGLQFNVIISDIQYLNKDLFLKLFMGIKLVEEFLINEGFDKAEGNLWVEHPEEQMLDYPFIYFNIRISGLSSKDALRLKEKLLNNEIFREEIVDYIHVEFWGK